jgi:hypothetical protein
MKLSGKIIVAWAAILGAYLVSLEIFAHANTPLSGHLNQLIQLLLLVIAVFIFMKEPNKKNKFIFLNFSLYFCLSVASFVYDFVGFAFLSGKYARFLFAEYLMVGYVFFLSVAVIYLVVDLLFRDFKSYQKYFVSLTIVFVFFGYYYYPVFSNPMHLYSTEDIKQWQTLDSYVAQSHAELNSIEIANKITLQSWKNGVATGDLYPEENLRRIEELLPYLEGNNWQVLFWKPIYLNAIHMDVLLVGFILLFFGYQYKKDPPQGAYIDKIMFLILLLQSMDILHNWGFIKSVEWGSFTELFTVGQYITVFAELMMVLFFALRLRFITSVQGEFYETEIAINPQQVSRWRDWVDNIVLAHFFNFKIFNGRLLQNPSAK